MTKHFKSLSLAVMSLILAILCAFIYCTDNYRITKASTEAMTRNIEVSQKSIDYESVFEEFEDPILETEGSLTTFEGVKTFDLADFDELDLVADAETGETPKMQVKYNFSYDAATGTVTLSARSINSNGSIEIDEIEGLAFYDENGDLDAYLDVDGENVLLSEMQEVGLIQNCGWFKKLWKKVVVAVAAVVVVAAVAAAVVATCGAGLGACIAAGAIAGSITGGVAGGIISYSEYGKLDWRWIVGGAIIGGAIGAVTGWGVGTAMGCSTNVASKGYLSKDFNFSKTVLNHTDRPYRDSQLLAKEIMKAGNPIKDPGGIVGGLKWTVPGSFNGTLGTWELVYDVTNNTIVHFLFFV